MAFSLITIQQIIQARVLQPIHDSEKLIAQFIFDSRRITFAQDSMFCSLDGDRRSGLDFLSNAHDKGIRHFLVSQKFIERDFSYLTDSTIFFVANVLDAIQKLAIHHRSQFPELQVLGITGSYAKTIVKEWGFHLLKNAYNIVRSPNSFNSQLGVPLSIFETRLQNNFAIFEAGISETNSMQKLEKIIQPTIGIFTNIGEAHNSGFRNSTQKAVEKSLLFTNSKVIIYNKDSEPLDFAMNQLKNRSMSLNQGQLFFSWSKKNTSAHFYINKIQKLEQETQLQGILSHVEGNRQLSLTIPFIDDNSIDNCIHLWCLMIYLEFDNTVMQSRFSLLQPLYLGLEIIKGQDGSHVFVDTGQTNANSIVNMIENVSQYQNQSPKTLILLDKLHTHKEAKEEVLELANILQSKGVKNLLTIDEMYIHYEHILKNHFSGSLSCFENLNTFLAYLKTTSFTNHSVLIKGTNRDAIEQLISELEENTHETFLEINLSHLSHNINQIRSLIKKKTMLMCMVKAFAYGGGVPIAQKIQSMGVDYLAVAYTEEGVYLRKQGITIPIMVMCPEKRSYNKLIRYNLEPEIFSLQTLQDFIAAIDNTDKNIFPVHLKIDTGMHRLGLESKDLGKALKILSQSNLVVQSVFSHLAYAGEEKFDKLTRSQILKFSNAANAIEKALQYPVIKHILNSKGIETLNKYEFDMVRLGIGMFGVNIDNPLLDIKHVITFRSTISQIKTARKGDFVGYYFKKLLAQETKVATVRVGYADGYKRTLGNGVGKVKINRKDAKIIGNVCMDMLMVDVTTIPNVKVGDEVILFGESPRIEHVAKWAKTIPYEILTGLSQRVKRIYKEDK